MSDKEKYIQGRGAQVRPDNRFQSAKTGDSFDDINLDDEPLAKTKFIQVFPKTIVNKVTSIDIGQMYSLNPYQGCEHGCTYCYARPSHEYWGYSAGIEFEQTILVKKNAPELLEKTLQNKNWEVNTITLSGNTDCYQPCERTFGITRKLLEIMLKYKHPVSIITKNVLINRDIDILEELAKLQLISVNISLTTLNEDLRRKLEPRTATAKRKLDLIEQLSSKAIPVNIMVAPIIPALNDVELFNIFKETSKRGALSAYYQIVRLSGANQQIFTDWATKNFPDRASKILNQLKEIQGESLGDNLSEMRLKGEGNFALNIKRQFELARKTFMNKHPFPKLRKDIFQRPYDQKEQMNLF